MSNNLTVPLLNLEDGKVKLAKDQQNAKELLSDPKFKPFPQYWENPGKLYYYEYDANLNKQLGQQAKTLAAVTPIGEEEALEVTVL